MLKSLPSGKKYFDITQIPNVSRLPICLRIILESLLRNKDDKVVTQAHIDALANWQANGERTEEVPFYVSRVVLQDYTGVPLLVDLAAMRDAAAKQGHDPKSIEPLVPVSLVIDHSVQTNVTRVPDALTQNMQLEFKRNQERYQFLKWGMGAFDTFDVVPPGIGIVHQVNLEHLAQGISRDADLLYPDTLVGTDSHTTMINAVGVVGWGVGGIEAEAAMLGQPVYILMPDVIGVHLTGELPEGATATDLVLRVTELMRETNVVGKFVEFFGKSARHLSVQDRATIANMAPDYGATMGFFGIDDNTLDYFKATGRSEENIRDTKEYFTAQGMFGIPHSGDCDYTQVLELNLSDIRPCIAGPKRPQDRIDLTDVKQSLDYKEQPGRTVQDGDILIAAITSCTNTSNPMVLLGAGLLAKKAVEKGLSVDARIKSSLAPGSRVVTDYLEQADLQKYLDQLGFNLAGYGCTTCIGNVGNLDAELEKYVLENKITAAAVLSGNRNFEARIHPSIRANFLMSPPLVVAYAIAGNMRVDLSKEPLGNDPEGNPVYLKDIWPSQQEIKEVLHFAMDPANYQKRYGHINADAPMWQEIQGGHEAQYQWVDKSTYIANPPFFNDFTVTPKAKSNIQNARALAILGDTVTTDHISPAGSINLDSPAGRYLRANNIEHKDFNSYGARRGNHEVMMRGTFSNVRIKNKMVPGVEGGFTVYQPSKEQLPIYDAAMRYVQEKTPLIIFAGTEYGTGSSRDWAAKGTQLLGVDVVVAKSYERIHRSNLIGMGVLPCQFTNDNDCESLKLIGDETFNVIGLEQEITPGMELKLEINRADGSSEVVPILARLDTPVEVEYYAHDGILPFMLRKILSE